MGVNKINDKGNEYKISSVVTDYEISDLPNHSGGTNSYMLKKSDNIITLNVDNIWVNSITGGEWTKLGIIPEEIRPEVAIQVAAVASRGDTGAVITYGKLGITADGIIQCKMNSGYNTLTAISFSIVWIV